MWNQVAFDYQVFRLKNGELSDYHSSFTPVSSFFHQYRLYLFQMITPESLRSDTQCSQTTSTSPCSNEHDRLFSLVFDVPADRSLDHRRVWARDVNRAVVHVVWPTRFYTHSQTRKKHNYKSVRSNEWPGNDDERKNADIDIVWPRANSPWWNAWPGKQKNKVRLISGRT